MRRFADGWEDGCCRSGRVFLGAQNVRERPSAEEAPFHGRGRHREVDGHAAGKGFSDSGGLPALPAGENLGGTVLPARAAGCFVVPAARPAHFFGVDGLC